jgi:hypothetical protein
MRSVDSRRPRSCPAPHRIRPRRTCSATQYLLAVLRQYISYNTGVAGDENRGPPDWGLGIAGHDATEPLNSHARAPASITALAALPTRCSDLLLDADGADRHRRRGLARTRRSQSSAKLEPPDLAVEPGGHVTRSSPTTPLSSADEEDVPTGGSPSLSSEALSWPCVPPGCHRCRLRGPRWGSGPCRGGGARRGCSAARGAAPRTPPATARRGVLLENLQQAQLDGVLAPPRHGRRGPVDVPAAPV